MKVCVGMARRSSSTLLSRRDPGSEPNEQVMSGETGQPGERVAKVIARAGLAADAAA